jgi:translation initiation factor 3 subunit C
MSRFFQASDSSESESDAEELYSDGEEEVPKPAASDDEDDSESEAGDGSDDSDSSDEEGGVTGAARFLLADSSSDESSDGESGKVVKSAKDKRFDEAESVVKMIENAVKIDDWVVISTEFDKLGRLIPNLVKILGGKNPKLYSMLYAAQETRLTNVQSRSFPILQQLRLRHTRSKRAQAKRPLQPTSSVV